MIIDMPLSRLFIFLVIVLIGGCGDDHDSDAPKELPEESLPGNYSGVFPCDGCPGIASTLWLRSDGRFFFKQQYPADNVREATDVYSLGRWNPIADEHAIQLIGAGPTRTFVRLDNDTLVMRTDSNPEHRLTRDSMTTDFPATIRMTGMMRMLGDSASFTECSTGYVVPVRKGGDFTRFRHQFRSVAGRGEPAYVELEGRFSWSGDGTLKSLTIERFITVKTNRAC